jgi:transcriptional regulator with XRE-family HTH domain
MFKDRLRLLRTESTLTQQELSDKTGINRSLLSHYEKGIREPNLETLEIFADYFNVDTDYLLGKTDIKRLYTFIDNDDHTLTDAINILMMKKDTKLNELIIKLSKLSHEEIIAWHKVIK